jgi:hypothetical protein
LAEFTKREPLDFGKNHHFDEAVKMLFFKQAYLKQKKNQQKT